MKKLMLLGALCLLSVTLIAQLNSSEITVPPTLEPAEEPVFENGYWRYRATERVTLDVGFEYTATQTNQLKAYIDSYQTSPGGFDSSPNSLSEMEQDIDQSLEVGTMTGALGVGDNGSANYTLALPIPEALNGLMPQLNLSYNSDAGEGALGKGWQLGGMSAISRGGRNMHYFIANRAVRNDNYDVFLLDGTELWQASGENGENLTTYGTSIESYQDITSHGSVGQGPEYFEVLTKNGLRKIYGGTTDSRLVLDAPESDLGSDVWTWKLSSIEDRNGNSIRFYYEKSSNAPDLNNLYIKRIEYGGKHGTQFPFRNTIDFSYEEHGQTVSEFIRGGDFTQNRILTEIRSSVSLDDEIYSQVFFRYNQGRVITLEEVEMVDAEGVQLNPQKFLYNMGHSISPLWALNNLMSANQSGDFDFLVADFNGDAKSDCMAKDFNFDITQGQKHYTAFKGQYADYYDESSGYYVFTQSSNPISLPDDITLVAPNPFPSASSSSRGKDGVRNMDFNGDGAQDLLFYTTNQSTYDDDIFEAYLSEPSGSGLSVTFNGDNTEDLTVDLSHFANHRELVGDFNGDGKSDLFVFGPSNRDWKLHSFTDEWLTSSGTGLDLDFAPALHNGGVMYPVNIDGDPNEELLIWKGSGSCSVVEFDFERNGSGDITGVSLVKLLDDDSQPFSDKMSPGDFNGDGITDLFYYGSGTLNVSICTGIEFQSQTALAFELFDPADETLLSTSFNKVRTIIADVNNDGFTDAIYFAQHHAGSILKAYVNIGNGRGYEERYTISIDNYPLNLHTDINTGDFDGNGVQEILIKSMGSPLKIIDIDLDPNANQLRIVKDGFANLEKIEYAPLTDYSVYSEDENLSFPLVSYNSTKSVVKSIEMTSPAGNILNTSYRYENGIMHKQGLGFLGFKEVNTLADLNSNRTTKTYTFANDNYKQILESTSTDLATDLLNQAYENLSRVDFGFDVQTTTTFNYFNQTFPRIQEVQLLTQDSHDFVKGRTSKRENVLFDDDGNITLYRDLIGPLEFSGLGELRRVFQNTYLLQAGWNRRYLLKESIITTILSNHVATDEGFTETQDYGYTDTGILEYSESMTGVRTEYSDFNQFSLPERITVSVPNDPSLESSETFVEYSPETLHGHRVTNNLGETHISEYAPKYGQLSYEIDANGNATIYQYDGLGRVTKARDVFDRIVQVDRLWETPSDTYYNPFDYNFRTRWKEEYSGDHIPVNDILYTNENLKRGGYEVSQPNVSSAIYQNYQIFHFDDFGRTASSTLPFRELDLDSPPSTWTGMATVYDEQGRVDKVEHVNQIGTASFDLPSITHVYSLDVGTNLYRTESSHSSGRVAYSETDVLGRLVNSHDGTNLITNSYFSHGGIEKVKVNGVDMTTMTYDDYGRQVSLDDVDAGLTQYFYDAYDRLTDQIDAKGNAYHNVYDDKGRLVTMDVFSAASWDVGLEEISGTSEGHYTYEYHAEGQLGANEIKRITAPNNYFTEYEYDEFDQVVAIVESVEDELFRTDLEYEADRLVKVTYPVNSSGGRFSVHRSYTPQGHLSSISNEDGTVVYWEARKNLANGSYNEFSRGDIISDQVMDRYYRPIEMSTDQFNVLGSDYYSYIQKLHTAHDNHTGNVLYRKDFTAGDGTDAMSEGHEENFVYDPDTDALTTAAHGDLDYSVPDDELIMCYSTDDDTCDDQGGGIGNLRYKSDVGAYEYDDQRIHQVKRIEDPYGIIPVTHQSVTYTEFNSVESITQTPYSYHVHYGPDDQRRLSVLNDFDGSAEGEEIRRRYYIGDYQKQVNADGSSVEVHYISSPSGLVAMHVLDEAAVTERDYAVYTDHLGSITRLTEMDGTDPLVDGTPTPWRMNFGPWGRHRDPLTWTYLTGSPMMDGTLPSWLWIGFTGHEHLDEFGLINMNGRCYDPALGRMLSPDNFVQDPSNSQNFNRYSYVLNNPLKYVDPSGERVDDIYYNVLGQEVQRIKNDKPDRHFVVDESKASEGKLTVIEEVTDKVNAAEAKDKREAALNHLARFGTSEQIAPLLARNDNRLNQGEKIQLMRNSVRYSGNKFDDAAGNIPSFVLLTGMTAGLSSSPGILGVGMKGTTNVGVAVNRVQRTRDVLGHIFRNARGHVNPGTSTSQGRYLSLFEKVANNPRNLNPSILNADAASSGVNAFTQTFRNGKQVWVHSRNGRIFDAGVNLIPR